MWKLYYDFDISGAKVFWFPVGGLVPMIIGLYILKGIKEGLIDEEKYPPFLMYIWIGFAALWTLFATYSVSNEYFEVKNIINDNRFEIVEGKVENFKSLKKESFTVKGIEFEYSDGNVNIGFNKPKSKGGPIDSNKYVRMHHYEGIILRLWIKE